MIILFITNKEVQMQLENMQYVIKQIPNHMWISTYFNFNKIYFTSRLNKKGMIAHGITYISHRHL